jgi:hypothetical protein
MILELLLLCWPKQQVPYVAVGSADEEKMSLTELVARHRWSWLLLMIALLQQMSTEHKQQLLQQRGPLLMQLLYLVLLEDAGRRCGPAKCWPGGVFSISGLLTATGDAAWQSWYLAVTNGMKEGSSQEPRKETQWAASVPLAVTMVLQNLLYESLPESWVDPKTARIGKSLIVTPGKCGTRSRG